MYRLLFVTIALVFASVGGAHPQTPLCTDELAEQTWNRALDAYEADDLSRTATEIDALLLACEDSPSTYIPRILRTEIALGEANTALARDLLSPLPNTYLSSLAAHAAWLKLIVAIQLQDEAGFASVRQALLEASHAFLSDPYGAAAGRHVETWKTGTSTVSAYEARLVQGSFVRRFVFIVAPDGLALPRSVTITQSAATSLMADLGLDGEANKDTPTPLAVDGYECSTHYTLAWIDSEMDVDGPTVSYETAKAAVLPALNDEADAMSSTRHANATCSFSGYITPVE